MSQDMANPAGHDIEPKPIRWVGSSKDDVRDFPRDVRRRVGGALWDAQCGLKAPYAKPLRGLTDPPCAAPHRLGMHRRRGAGAITLLDRPKIIPSCRRLGGAGHALAGRLGR